MNLKILNKLKTYVGIPLLFLAFCLCSLRVSAEGQGVGRQHRINEAVASLERARRAILETPKLRGEKESLPTYFSRLLVSKTGRLLSAEVWRNYITLLEKASDETAVFRKSPLLLTDTPENRKLWAGATLSLQKLSNTMVVLKASEKAGGEPLAKAFTRALTVLVEARDRLRNVRP